MEQAATESDGKSARGVGQETVETEILSTKEKRRELSIQAIAILAWAYGAYWIWWRWSATLNPEAMAFSVTLAAAETYGFLTSTMLLFTVFSPLKRKKPARIDGFTVDVFITTYDEPLEVIRRTAIGARQIRYPHQTFILDDGHKEEVKALAASIGVGYISREGNAHAKAGNLNNAIKLTKGDLILQLDADHVPMPQILDDLTGYFKDERLAFVQSPQDFYNTDSFTHVVNKEGRTLWEENRFFFSLIQPGRDRYNAAFFCGSCGVLRRKAIEEIGGFSTLSITEDIETSIVLHARGWRSAYHRQTLAYGLAPGSAGAYAVQRLRWGQGAMQLLRKMNPLFYPGLTFSQRVAYFGSLVTYMDGFQKLVFYLAPVVFLLTGLYPVRVGDGELVIRLVPYLFLTIASFELLSRGTGWLLISERFSMIRFFTYIMAVSGYFIRNLKFNVTPKGASGVSPKVYAPQAVVAALSGLAILWAWTGGMGMVTYEASELAMALNGAWAAWNMFFAVTVVYMSVASRQQREDHRFADVLPLFIDTGDGTRRYGATRDINPLGLSFVSSTEIPKGQEIAMRMHLARETVMVRGKVQHASPPDGQGMHRYGVRLEYDDKATEEAIGLHCTHHSVPLYMMGYRQCVDLFTKAGETFGNFRQRPRTSVHMPALVKSTDVDVFGVIEDVSTKGARVVLGEALLPGEKVSYEVPGTKIKGHGVIAYNRMMQTSMGTRFVCGIDSQIRHEGMRPMGQISRWRRTWKGGRKIAPGKRAGVQTVS